MFSGTIATSLSVCKQICEAGLKLKKYFSPCEIAGVKMRLSGILKLFSNVCVCVYVCVCMRVSVSVWTLCVHLCVAYKYTSEIIWCNTLIWSGNFYLPFSPVASSCSGSGLLYIGLIKIAKHLKNLLALHYSEILPWPRFKLTAIF